MRMLEVFTSDRTYMPVLQDANCVTALIEQILHYMVQKGIIFNSRGNAYLYWVTVCVVLSLLAKCALHVYRMWLLFYILLAFSPVGYYRSLYVLVNHKLPSSLEYSDAPSIPLAHTLLEHTLKPLHFTYGSCPPDARYTLTWVHTKKIKSALIIHRLWRVHTMLST